jgi:O-antigen ligase
MISCAALSTPTGTLSDPRTLRDARHLRLLSGCLEALLAVVIAGTVFAFGAVHAFAYVPLWCAAVAMGGLLLERAATMAALRRRIGRSRFSFHSSGLWIVLDRETPSDERGWSFDLERPALPRGPLLLPGLALAALVLLQLLPLPRGLVAALNGRQLDVARAAGGWLSLTISVADTIRGLAFLATILLVHVAAGVVLDRSAGRERFRQFLGGLGLVLALVALAQMASGTTLVYGFFRPQEAEGGPTIFGPFINRNDFGGYMLLVIPVALGRAASAARGYLRRTGDRANLRRWLVGLRSSEGTRLIDATAAALATIAALVASTSRGAMLAFAASLMLAGLLSRTRQRLLLLLLPIALAGLAVFWFGTERLSHRFSLALHVRADRPVLWRETVKRMDGIWLLGSGFNTFGTAMSRVSAWKLPLGATPWREPYETSVALTPRAGFSSPAEIPWLTWYREAHNDYLQVLVENGLPGLLLALLALVAVLRPARYDPWLFCALAGVALHCLVDFDLQIPAIAVLFVTLAALAAPARGASRRTAGRSTLAEEAEDAPGGEEPA